jgi:hypothetical protein
MVDRLKRYLLFYLAVGSFYGVYSFVFDLIFCRIDYGSECHYEYPLSFNFYFFTLLFYYFIYAFPIAMTYNSVINHYLKNSNNIFRYAFGLLVGLSIGYSIHRFG